MGNRDIISIGDLSKEEITALLDKAKALQKTGRPQALHGKILATLFFEPSTRTRLSFEAAMYRLGGNVIGFSEERHLSTQKGETLSDTIRVISSYADAITIRHPFEGAARLAADYADIPIINAGDGSRQHPTQTLLDLFSIRECHGKLEGLKVAFVGDLKYGRAAHSLAIACALFGMRLYFVSPEALMLPDYITDGIKRTGIKYSFHRAIEEVIEKADILYMLRTQKERFDTPAEYARVKECYTLDVATVERGKESLRILHPLPRVDEIAPEVDALNQAYYFQQAANGIFVRQAVLLHILGESHG